eukprot:scaffold28733_cov75-Phaeocystis_antarctica.AAC.1
MSKFARVLFHTGTHSPQNNTGGATQLLHTYSATVHGLVTTGMFSAIAGGGVDGGGGCGGEPP